MTKEIKNENVLEQLELVDVVVNDGKAVLTFLDEEAGEIREVSFNKKSYDKDKGEFVPDDDKAEQVEEWSQTYFGTTFDKLGTAIGQKHDVYAYDKFNSLWEVEITNKFDKDTDEGIIFETEIESIEDDGKAVHIYFQYEGKRYESKMGYADYLEAKKEWFTNPQKKNKQYKKFEEKYGVPVEDADKIVGNKIMCEVKVAFKKHAYVEIKQPRWEK